MPQRRTNNNNVQLEAVE